MRDFNYDHDESINYKPYHDRLNRPSFPLFMQAVFSLMLRSFVVKALRPSVYEQALSHIKAEREQQRENNRAKDLGKSGGRER